MSTRRAAGAFVRRRGAGELQRTAVEAGTVWFCPAGVREDELHISGPLPEILHVQERTLRTAAAIQRDSPIRPDEIRDLAGVEDMFVRQLVETIGRELREERAAGPMMVEAAALALISFVTQQYGHDPVDAGIPDRYAGCPVRIRRVIDYIGDNIGRDMTVAELAEVGCLSPFHFSRVFKAVTGQTPYAFVSTERLKLARQLLTHSEESIASIALRLGFSSQSAFSTAFRRSTGSTPRGYRRATAANARQAMPDRP